MSGHPRLPGCLQLPQLNPVASEPVLSPHVHPFPSSEIFLLCSPNLVSCQQDQCSFSINWKLSSPSCFKENLCLHQRNCFPWRSLSGVILSLIEIDYVLLAPYCYFQTSFQSFLISKNHPFSSLCHGLCPFPVISHYFLSPKCQEDPLRFPLPKPATHSSLAVA